MGIKEAVQPVSTANQKVYKGTQNPVPTEWIPFEWEEPGLGKQVHGQISMVRTEGNSGSLTAGFWRSTGQGAAADGSHFVHYSSPLGDETACVLEGSVILTVKSTGKKYYAGPGSIINSPKNLEVTWEFQAPYFRKYWVIWNGSEATPNPPRDLLVTNINDNPAEWQEYHFDEPKEGHQARGELIYIRSGGSTGTMMSGLWRSGKNIIGCDEKGTCSTPYTATLGDEIALILEGSVDVIETKTGKKHEFHAGDIVGLSKGMHVTWVSKGPFCKKLWVITNDKLPE